MGTVLGCALAVQPMTAAIAGTPGKMRRDQRPNIIVILLDDLGFSDFGSYGSEIRTPNIDALAQAGLRYNRFDTKAICSATRAALLTGRNNQAVRMARLPSRLLKPDHADQSKDKGELPANVELLPAALAKTGYATFAVGKWHLSPAYEGGPGGPADPGGAKASWPLQRGFQHYYGFLGGWTDQYAPKLIADNAPIATPVRAGYHVTEDLVDHAIADLKTNEASGKPAFLYLAFGATHTPVQVPKSYIDAYAGTYEKGWDSVRAARFERMKAMGVIPRNTVLPPRAKSDPAWNTLSAEQQQVYSRFMAAYAGFLTHTDEHIGRLFEYLRRSGQYDNSLIVIMSDNGAAGEGGLKGFFRKAYFDTATFEEARDHLDELGGPTTQPIYQRPWAMSSNTPFRRYKSWPYAGGSRVPLIISWPAKIRDPGAIRSSHVDVIDVAPTLLDAAGTSFLKKIDGAVQLPVAGRSILRGVLDRSAKVGRARQYFELDGNRAIRIGDWKAVAIHRNGMPFEQDEWRLFDLNTDFAEAHDVASSHPALLQKLKAAWAREAKANGGLPLTKYGGPFSKSDEFDED
ncbi:arylsulfatase [Sphingobium sp.]|uniref:arylsulfatase n=1 Tax=Sphingobium sp. TaxID=1912891 RepID=UPI0035C69F6E